MQIERSTLVVVVIGALAGLVASITSTAYTPKQIIQVQRPECITYLTQEF